jgi:predicted transcriptional regulator
MHNTIKALLKEGAIIEADNRYVITSAGKEVIDGVKKMGNLKQTHQKPRIKTN